MKNVIFYVVLTVFVSSCAVHRSIDNVKNEKLVDFLSLFQDYCFDFESTASVDENAKQHSIWVPSKQWEGMYEYSYKGVSYALTPDEGYCTLDVLLIQHDNILFAKAEVKEYVRSMTGYSIFSVENKMELNANEEEISISEVIFKRRKTETNYIVLEYPLERFSEYYMTLNYYY